MNLPAAQPVERDERASRQLHLIQATFALGNRNVEFCASELRRQGKLGLKRMPSGLQVFLHWKYGRAAKRIRAWFEELTPTERECMFSLAATSQELDKLLMSPEIPAQRPLHIAQSEARLRRMVERGLIRYNKAWFES